jgi:hypothetical protein
MADNYLRERGNEENLKKSEYYLSKNWECIATMMDLKEDEECKEAFFVVGMHYQLVARLHARRLEK